MEKEFYFDQEAITINVTEENAFDEHVEEVTEGLSAEDYTVADESEIDWSTL